MKLLPVLAGSALVLALAHTAASQVLIAPAYVVLRQGSPFGSYLVINQGITPQEVTVGFRFGYPVTDSTGTLRMVYGDTLPLAGRSLQGWMRAFPRQFTLAPGQRQTVRLVARAQPSPLGDGVYWTRIVTTSTPPAPPVDGTTTGVSAAVRLTFEQITTVLYRRGQLSTGVDFDAPGTTTNGNSLAVAVPVRLSGNAPFLGTFTAALLDARNTTVAADTSVVAVYLSGRRQFAFEPRPAAGTYTLELRATSQRNDVAREDLVQAPLVVRRFPLVVP